MKCYLTPLVYSLASSLLVVPTEANLLRGEGGLVEAMELSVLSEISRQLQEAVEAAPAAADEQLEEELLNEAMTEAVMEEAYYEKKSDESLLNQLIAFFLPHINSMWRDLIPDPLGVPYDGNFSLPRMNLFGGSCSADAGVNFNFGTMTGASSLSIDNIRVIAGTEQVDAHWKLSEGCFKTLWSAFFEIDISSDAELKISDLGAGVSARACSYEIAEDITGGIRTFQPKLHGRVNISGILFGTQATLGNVKFVDRAFKVGYSSVEAYLNDVPPPVNEAVANITRELSMVAKDKFVDYVMQDESFIRAFEPQMQANARESIESREVTLDYVDAFRLGGSFVINSIMRNDDSAMGSVLNTASGLMNSLGFGSSPTASAAREEDTASGVDAGSVATNVIHTAGNFFSGLGFSASPVKQQAGP